MQVEVAVMVNCIFLLVFLRYELNNLKRPLAPRTRTAICKRAMTTSAVGVISILMQTLKTTRMKPKMMKTKGSKMTDQEILQSILIKV